MTNYIETLDEFINRQQRVTKTQIKKLNERIKKLSVEFRQKFPTVTQLSLVGSFIQPEFFSKYSDLDFLVTGLPKEEYFNAYLFIESKIKRPIHLICEEEIPQNLRKKFSKRRVLYEKKKS
jgi:predicted nucleotidyltransferase